MIPIGMHSAARQRLLEQWNKEKKAYEITNECNITLHQIEMWLCEYQKYWKMVIGEGKQRSEFQPKTNIKYKWIQKELFQ